MAGGMSTAAGAGLGYWQGGTLTSAGAGAVLFRMARGRINKNVARRVGEMLASNDPEVYKRALEMVEKSKGISKFIESIAPRSVSAALPAVMNEWQLNGPECNEYGAPY